MRLMKKRKIIKISQLILFTFIVITVFCSKEEKNQKINVKEKEIDISTLRAKNTFKGKIVFQSDMDGDKEIYLLTARQLKKLTDNSWDDEYPRWSPDGKRIAYTANPKGNYDVFVMNNDGSNIHQVTSSPKDEIEHAWFPDGKRIAFTEFVKRGFRRRFTLWMIDLKSKKTEKIIPEFRNSNALPNFSPVGPLMAFTGKRTIGWDVFIYDLEKKEYRSLTEGGKSCRANFYKDGSITYVSSEADGKGDIWLMEPDGSGKTRLTERDDTYDYFPSWSADGKYIVFSSSPKNHNLRGNWALYLVKVKTKIIVPLFDSPGRDLFPDWY
jgi:Tol biopolymer transport system component